MEQIRKAVLVASSVTGEQIWEAIQKIAKERGFIPVHRETVLEDDGHGFVQGYTLGFESAPADPVLWFVIGHGPAADRNLFMERPYSKLFICTCRSLEYKSDKKIFEQKLITAQGFITGSLQILAEELEKFFLPAS